MSSKFSTIPFKASQQPKPFKAHVSDQDLADFKQLLKLSKIGPATYENQHTNIEDVGSYGISREWLQKAKQHWETTYDWRKTEDRINSFPNFTAPIEVDGVTITVHFVALFSKKPNAVPVTLLHGWPGSFLEFLGTLDVLRKKYSEDDLPYHVIVPSLPGYGYSSGPPLDQNWTIAQTSKVIDKLLVGLGFGDGYIAQGGDLGAFVSWIVGATSPACKAIHLNMFVGSRESSLDGLDDAEKGGLLRAQKFMTLGAAYAQEQGTKTATIGLVLSSSPLALLGWVGEKFLQWTDQSPALDDILDSVTLYWLTETLSRSCYPYRQFFGDNPSYIHSDPAYKMTKPMGYSWHPQELNPAPKDWVAKSVNLAWHRVHSQGGHFAAMERPDAFVKDIEDFVGEVWPKAK